MLLLAIVGVVALLTRLPGLDTSPPGFAIDEARAAGYARSVGTNEGPVPLLPDSTEPGERDPLFAWALKLTGSVSGWSVAGARMATALAGVMVALCCGLWMRRALGTVWGLTGGLLVATSFWQMTLGRQVSAGMTGLALLALGTLLLWHGLDIGRVRAGGRVARWVRFAPAGVAFGLAVYAFAPLLAFVPALVLACGMLAWRTSRERGDVDWRALGAGLAVLLAIVTPAGIDAALHPGEAGARIESGFTNPDPDGASLDPAAVAGGLATTIESLFWRGPDDARIHLAGRGLLDPLLSLWTVLGIAYALRFVTRPLHAFALTWLLVCLALSAAISPGHPELLLAATPAIFLFPVLALRSAHAWARSRGSLSREVALVLVAGTVIASAAWSIVDYTGRWSSSTETWEAFNGDVRDALGALAQLSGEAEPVYISSWGAEPLIGFLPTERPVIQVDGRVSIVIPQASSHYIIIPRSTPPDVTLLRYVTGSGPDRTDQPTASGLGPDGATAWEIWPVGQGARERLPLTLPTIRFPNRIQLTGFAFAPDFGDVARTGTLPDPPRLIATLVWSVPLDIEPIDVEVRLVPADPLLGDLTETASDRLTTGTNIGDEREAGRTGRVIVLQRLSIVVPQTDDMVMDIEIALRDAEGTPRPAYGPRQFLSGEYVFLNRVQYQPGIPDE